MSDTPQNVYYDTTGKTDEKSVASTSSSSSSSSDSKDEETAEDIEKKEEEEQQKEDEEEEEEFHPHKGKIMGIKPYTQISEVSWHKSYDNPTGTGKAELHYSTEDKEEFIKYVYKGVSCKLKLRRSNEKQFTATGLEEIDLTEEEIVEREHYPTKEQLEEISVAESLEKLEEGKEEKTQEDKEKEAEENKPYIRSDGDGGIYGFVTDVTHDSKGTELEIKDWGYCLEDDTKELSFNNMLRSQIIEEVIKSYGLVPAVDFTGLKDDMISWTNVTSSGSGDSSDDGTGSINADGSMTEDQVWEIASTFSYAGIGTNHDPEKAWEMIGTKKGSSADCYDCTAWLYYVYNFKVGIPARDICYHSDYASSGSHHTIQYFKNNQWIDPPEYDKITTNLKVIKSRNKSQDHICRTPPSGGSIPSYDRCPHSSNG